MTTVVNEDDQMIREAAQTFAETRLRPNVMDWDERQYFPKDVMHAMGELGFLGVLVPTEYGWK